MGLSDFDALQSKQAFNKLVEAVDVLLSIGLSRERANRAAVASALHSELGFSILNSNRHWGAAMAIAIVLVGAFGLR